VLGVFRPVRKLWQGIRSHPKLSLVIALLLLATGLIAGIPLWALYHYRAAEQALEEGHLPRAREHIESYLAVWPRNPDANLLAARVERLAGNFPEAEGYLSRCKDLNHGATRATQLEWLLLRAQRGEVDQVARGLWRLVEDRGADSTIILETLARVYIRELRFPQALDCLHRWLDIEPNAVLALDWRGWVQERLEHFHEARKDYERALELAPERLEVRVRLTELLLTANDVRAARPHLRRLRQSDPDRPDVLIALARCRFLQGKFPEARTLLDRVLADQPENVNALICRGKLDLRANRPAQAEAWLRRALRHNPLDIEVQNALYDSLRRQPNRAREAAAQERRCKEVKARTERLGMLLRGGAEKHAGNPAAFAEVGAILLDMGQDSLAIYWLSRALKLDSHHRRTHEVLARYYDKLKQPAKAAQHRGLARGKEPIRK
jgi:tetratricopeptide (TPR) repeat protein